MKLLLSALVVLPLAQPASAQRLNGPTSSSVIIAQGDNYQGHVRQLGYRYDGKDDAKRTRECLTSKASGNVYCLTRAQWREVAEGKRRLR